MRLLVVLLHGCALLASSPPAVAVVSPASQAPSESAPALAPGTAVPPSTPAPAATPFAEASPPALQGGASAIDITPVTLPVLVNGGMLSRSVGRVKTRLHARALVLADKRTRIALVVVDSCMMGRPLLDEVKAIAARRTGIPTDHILISATHAHSAPSALACLGTEADASYVPFLRDRIAEAIGIAAAHLEPARIGFARADASAYTALRRWIRRPDRLAEDPFGNPTVRASMHAAANWDDVTGESGPKDPDLTLLSVQARDGRPIAVLGNFSMHYFTDDDLSADYFGLFADGLKQRLAPADAPGHAPFVGILSHGCSGDIWRRDDTRPASEWDPKRSIGDYTAGLLSIAERALNGIQHRADVDLAMSERRMTLKYRAPDRQRLEWAQRIVAGLEGREPSTVPEVYAREQVLLHERQQTEVVVQAVRIGDIGITAVPTETYALTGLRIKAASPLPRAMVIELANGGDGYIPPPEQHLFGGYNTWPARSAGLEITAEPRIAETAISLLEEVTGQPRRPHLPGFGQAALAIRRLAPQAWWRLEEFAGPHAADASGHGRDAVYEPAVAYHLEGPLSGAFAGPGERNRAIHAVGGRLRARLPGIGDRCSVALWIWNGMPVEARGVSGWFLSRGHDFGLGPDGDHLGIAGTNGPTGRLIFQHGANPASVTAGRTPIARWEWRQVVFVREGAAVRVYLDGRLEIEARARSGVPPGFDQWFFGGRSDHHENWEGRLDEVAVFDRPLTAGEVGSLRPGQAAENRPARPSNTEASASSWRTVRN